MRQVPLKQSYILVGDGRLARHLGRYFDLLGLSFTTWSRKSPTAFAEAAGRAAHALLAISDSAIEDFARANAEALRGKTVVHFSGALATPRASSAHPLMSFAERPYELEDYRRVPFVVEKDGPSFEELLPGLPNPHYAIPRVEKPLYHALCVLSGNFTVLLWSKLFGELEGRLGIPREAALPYLEAVATNLARDSRAALTGPLARGDRKTIESNIASLEGDPFQRVYRAFVEAHSLACDEAHKEVK